MVKLSDMESLTSRQGADRLGVNVQKFHRIVRNFGLRPVIEIEGKRGAKFWARADIEHVATAIALLENDGEVA